MLCIALALAWGAADAAKTTERSRQKAAAESSRAAIAQKLGALKRDISKTETEKDAVADTLAASEQAISNANRALRDLAEETAATNVKLKELAEASAKLAATIEAQKAQLARLLREQYVAGNEDRIKLLLSGDNPNRINRDLQMMAYVSKAQARLLESLRANLAAVETNQAEAQNAKDELEEIALEAQEQKAVLEKEKARRAGLLGSLSQKLASQRKEAGNLERNQQRLDGLVNQLAKLIKDEEAAAAEKRRLDALAAAKAKAKAAARAERDKQARLAAAKPGAKPFKPDPIDADEAPVAARAPEPKKPDISLAPVVVTGDFAAQRGQLRAPVAGKLAVKFGSKLGEGRWKGVFIKAAEGSDVRVVAAGRVIYADWVRGLGNLIIVDHGSGYWSAYGYNQALLKRAGDAVKAGDTVASSGTSGGQEESGLYFEMRHNTVPFDPVGWVKF